MGVNVLRVTMSITKRRAGIEVGFIGVDGTGKTSVANAVSFWNVPIKVIHMGNKNFQTRFMRLFEQKVIGWPFGRIATNYELLVRRLQGWNLARKGWIVIYDRHPIEHFEPDAKLFKHKVGNLLNAMYNWEPDLTFYFTGDYSTIFERKKEYSAAQLQQMDRKFRRILDIKRVAFHTINVTDLELESVVAIVKSYIGYCLPQISRAMTQASSEPSLKKQARSGQGEYL